MRAVSENAGLDGFVTRSMQRCPLVYSVVWQAGCLQRNVGRIWHYNQLSCVVEYTAVRWLCYRLITWFASSDYFGTIAWLQKLTAVLSRLRTYSVTAGSFKLSIVVIGGHNINKINKSKNILFQNIYFNDIYEKVLIRSTSVDCFWYSG